MSLTLGRRANESIIIDPQGLNIRVRAYAVNADGTTRHDTHIRVSIDCPRNLRVLREELLSRPEAES